MVILESSAQAKGFRPSKTKGFAAVDLVITGSAACRMRGFTLLELMIVIGLIALLMALALPSYTEFVVRTKLRTGTESLSAFRSVLEQGYQDNRSYRTVDDSACLIVSYPSENFSVTCAATSDVLYVLTATSAADQGLGAAGDYEYTIDQDGIARTTKFKGAAQTQTIWMYRSTDSS